MTETIKVSYDDHLAAVVSSQGRMGLEPHIELLAKGDPVRCFVQVMTSYAGAVIDGELARPFTSAGAEAVARSALLPDKERGILDGRSDEEVAVLCLIPVSLRWRSAGKNWGGMTWGGGGAVADLGWGRSLDAAALRGG